MSVAAIILEMVAEEVLPEMMAPAKMTQDQILRHPLNQQYQY